MQTTQNENKTKPKKKLARWIIYLIGMGVSFLLTGFSGELVSAGKISDGNLLFILPLLANIGFLFALIGYAFRAAGHRAAKRKHEAPAQASYNEISYSGVEESRPSDTAVSHERFTYNKDDAYRFSQTGSEMSWGYVMLYLFCFFPYGLFALIQKIITEKAHYYDNGAKLKIYCLAFLVPGAGMLLLCLKNARAVDTGFWVVCSVFGVATALGLTMLILGIVFQKKGKTYEQYLKAIVNDKITGIDELAARAKTTYGKAAAVIRKLIDNEMLPGAYIYHQDREVIVPGISKKLAFYCRNCGGTSVLYANEAKKCVYCGAEL